MLVVETPHPLVLSHPCQLSATKADTTAADPQVMMSTETISGRIYK